VLLNLLEMPSASLLAAGNADLWKRRSHPKLIGSPDQSITDHRSRGQFDLPLPLGLFVCVCVSVCVCVCVSFGVVSVVSYLFVFLSACVHLRASVCVHRVVAVQKNKQLDNVLE